MPSQASPPIHPSASAAAHLGRGPPGSWSGSCGGPQQTCNRTRRAPGRPAEARGLPSAHRCVPWAAWSSHPGSSAWCLERNTGPLPGQRRLSKWQGLKPRPHQPLEPCLESSLQASGLHQPASSFSPVLPHPQHHNWLRGCRGQRSRSNPGPRHGSQCSMGTHNIHFSLIAFWKLTFLFCRLFFALGQLRSSLV